MNPSLIGDTTALTTLGNAIRANTDQDVIDAVAGGSDSFVANWYNQDDPTPVWVFVSSIPVDRAVSDYDSADADPVGIDWDTDYAAFDEKDLAVLHMMFKNGSFDPRPAGARNALDKVCTGAAASKVGLLKLATRTATYAENVLKTTATGPGGGDGSARTTAAIATYSGSLTHTEVHAALAITA